jgi:hypothetical protein
MRKMPKPTHNANSRNLMLVRQLAAIFGVFVASLIILGGALRADDTAAPVESPAAEAATPSEAPASEAPASDAPTPANEPSAEETKE